VPGFKNYFNKLEIISNLEFYLDLDPSTSASPVAGNHELQLVAVSIINRFALFLSNGTFFVPRMSP
jgi:hypothetical protein